MPQTTHIFRKDGATDLCANCKHYSLIDGAHLCFANTDKQGRPRPHGVLPNNRCNCGRFLATIGLPSAAIRELSAKHPRRK